MSKQTASDQYHQQGVALISVLFVVVILTVLASQLLTQGWRDLDRTQWLQEQAQAYQYALGGEQLARQLLFADWQRLRSEGLNISPVPGPPSLYQPERGEIRLKITDLQGQINLNNILQTSYQTMIQRFFHDALQQPQLMTLLADWADGDTLPRPGGQEDSFYLSQSQPYRAGNRLLAHWSELNLLDGSLSPDTLKNVSSWVSTLPKPTPVNINTLTSERATVIHPGLSAAQLEASRAQGAFTSTNDFLQSTITAGLEILPTTITVNSEFYEATVLATRGDFQQALSSRFYMNPANGKIDLLDRSFLISTVQRQQLQGFEDFQDETDTAL